jgi:hypothetical protein
MKYVTTENAILYSELELLRKCAIALNGHQIPSFMCEAFLHSSQFRTADIVSVVPQS